MNCHHCGAAHAVPTQCPGCGAADLARVGAGTERLERDLAERFSVPVVRLDADAARSSGGVAPILESFANTRGGAILTGTQMIAKGHDFPDVELAVVIDADTALAIPDFRAEERAFSLLAQVAGRAGRSAQTADHARVMVQTWNPEREFLQFALSHDVDGFLEAEVARRRELDYPPFTRLVRVLVSAPDRTRADAWARAAADSMRSLDLGAVLGPAKLMRIAHRERAQILIKTRRANTVASAVRQALRASESSRRKEDVRMVLDVDPQSLI
jgi:primosomal protein N' (replication factor Y)